MQGNIDFIGSLSGDISGGGGGGSDVTITPTLTSGTKIANYEIDGEGGSLYAPTPTSLTAQLPLSISNNVISIDLSDFITDTELNTVLEDYTTYQYTESRYTPLATFNSYTISAESHFQKTLTAGTNITIDPVTNTISASGGSSWDYSTTEVNTGQKWIDGKDIYCCVINNVNDNSLIDLSSLNIDTLVHRYGYFITNNQIYDFNLYVNGTYSSFLQYNESDKTAYHNVSGWTTSARIVIYYYTKSA